MFKNQFNPNIIGFVPHFQSLFMSYDMLRIFLLFLNLFPIAPVRNGYANFVPCRFYSKETILKLGEVKLSGSFSA